AGRHGAVAGARGRERADRDAVHQHLEGLGAVLEVAALGGGEGQVVGAGRQVDRLAEAAEALEEGDLRALRGVGVAVREAAAVAGDARTAVERPRRAGRVVGEGAEEARAHVRRLERTLLEAAGRVHRLAAGRRGAGR